MKYRALRLEGGNFAWASEHVTRKTRIISVVRSTLHQFVVSSIHDIYMSRSITPQIMSSFEPTHLLKVPSFKLMPHPSVNGTNPT